MRLEARKYLFDIERAAGLVAQLTAGREFADYEQEDMLRSAVERQFEVIGEALAQLSKLDSVLASRITGYRRITPSATSSFMAMPKWTVGSSGT